LCPPTLKKVPPPMPVGCLEYELPEFEFYNVMRV